MSTGKFALFQYIMPLPKFTAELGPKVNGKSIPCPSTLVQVLQLQKRRQRRYKVYDSEHPGTKSVPEVLRIFRCYVRKEFIHEEKQRQKITRVRMPKADFEFTNLILCLCIVGHSIACSEYPIEISHTTHVLLSKYLTYVFLGADIFEKYVLQEFSHSFNGSRLLVKRVRERLEFAGVSYERGERSDLIVWMYFFALE